MNVQGMGGISSVADLLMNSGVRGPSAMPSSFSGGPPSQVSSIQNDQGQSLLDIRDELRSAVKDAMQEYDGSGDLRSTVRLAFECEQGCGVMSACLEGLTCHERPTARTSPRSRR